MNRAVKKIGIILLIIILLPAIIFSVYELSTLNQSEKVLENIYKNQLEAILFSVNQYSEDVTSNWAGQFNTIVNEWQNKPKILSAKLDSLTKNIPTINSFFIYNANRKTLKIYPAENNIDSSEIRRILLDNSAKSKRLFTYKKSGYRKIEPLPDTITTRNSMFVFILDNLEMCGILFNTDTFINSVLSPKISMVSGNEFNIAIINGRTNSHYFSDSLTANNIQQKRELWLLPDYYLAISLKGTTLETIVRERTITNFILIALLIIILIIGVWVVFRNIKKEIELAQIKSDFVSNVSHELRTPLSLISMFAETLEMGRIKTEEKKQEYYNIISQETSRLSRIVNKILSFSKMEAGKRTYNFKEMNLNETINEVYETYKFHLENNGFKFSLILDEAIPFINADSEAISEAIINLIDNAVKYSDEQKDISIKTGREKEFVTIEVEDKGVGITLDDQKKIFDKFYRVSSGLVHNSQGTGLGLTLVKNIVEAHKGKIDLRSEPGKGSSFKLYFLLSN